jgi:hypothetical protein
MKTKLLILHLIRLSLLLLTILFSISCSKDIDNISLDKRIFLTILDDHYGWASGYDTTICSSSIINFNKNDYTSIDSIFFVISDLITMSPLDGSNITKTVSIELFDLTNQVSIANSKIETDDVKESQFKSSGNLIDFLPEKPINLGIRIINDADSCVWELHGASLILVRK